VAFEPLAFETKRVLSWGEEWASGTQRALERILPRSSGMTLLKRFVPLVVTVLMSACIDLPEVADPEVPGDAGTKPDAGMPPDGGSPPDSGVPADMTPPTVTQVAPAHSSSQVATSTQLLLIFSEPMNVSTVQVSTTPLVNLGTSTWSHGDTQLTIQPGELLAQNTTYSLFVEGKDKAGNLLSGQKAYSFTTAGPAPDTTAPTVLSHTPGASAIGVARNATITVVFSEPMDKASAQTAFAITSPSGFNAGVFDWNSAGTEMTFNPDTDFSYGAEVAWRVSTAAKDLAGNTLGSEVAGTFRAVRISTVTINYDPKTSGTGTSPDYSIMTHYFTGASVGDYGPSGVQDRLLLGFRLDALPDDLLQIKYCTLKWYVSGQGGNPFQTLGKLLLESVYIGEEIALSDASTSNPVSKAQYESPTLGSPIAIPSSAIYTVTGVDVTSLVSAHWQERASRGNKRAQFRLRFEVPNDGDSENDIIYTDDSGPSLAELEMTYEHP
jgi:hypothetical protein